MRTLRAIGVLGAIVVCAWFALGAREAHDVSQAAAIVSGSSHLTAAQARHANALLHDATVLNPDREPDIIRGRVASGRGDNARADRIFLSVTAAEPQNLEAWAWLGRESASRRLVLMAYGHLALLAPPVTNRR